MANEEYEGFDLTVYNLFKLMEQVYYTKGQTELNFLQKSGGTLGGSLTIQGNLTVQGNSYKIDTEDLVVKDYTITLAKDNNSALVSMVGMVVPKYDGTNYGFFGWDADGYAYVGDLDNWDGSSAITLANNSSLQKIATIKDTATGTTSDDIMVYDQTNKVFKKAPSGRYVIEDNELVASNDNKALYHINEYDSKSGNVVSRGHWSVNLSKFILDNASNFTFRATAGGYELGNDSGIGAFNGALIGNNNLITATSNNSNFAFGTDSDAWGNTGGYIICNSWISLPNTYTTKDSYIQYFSQNEIIVTYKLATSYTEQVIENTPLLDLDQAGCNYVRSEWEKSLNLWELGYPQCSITAQGAIQVDGNWNVSKMISVQPNTSYTINGSTNEVWHFFYYDSSKNFLSYRSTGTTGTATITTPSNCYYMYSQVGSTYSNIMLNEGTHAYPYQEYNGAIVREGFFNKATITITSGTTTIDTNVDYIISTGVQDSNNAYDYRTPTQGISFFVDLNNNLKVYSSSSNDFIGRKAIIVYTKL